MYEYRHREKSSWRSPRGDRAQKPNIHPSTSNSRTFDRLGCYAAQFAPLSVHLLHSSICIMNAGVNYNYCNIV